MAEPKEPGGDSTHAGLIGIVSAGALGILEIGAQIASGGVSAIRFIVLLVAAAVGGLCIYCALVRRWGRATVLGVVCLVLLGLIAAFGPAARHSVTQPKASTEVSSPSGGLTPESPPTTTPGSPTGPPSSSPSPSPQVPPPTTADSLVQRLRSSATAVHGTLSIKVMQVMVDSGHIVVTARVRNSGDTYSYDFYGVTLVDNSKEKTHNRSPDDGGDFPGQLHPGESLTSTIRFDGTLPSQSTRITIYFGDTISTGPGDFFDLAAVADLN